MHSHRLLPPYLWLLASDGHTNDGGAHPPKSKVDDRKHPPGGGGDGGGRGVGGVSGGDVRVFHFQMEKHIAP